MSIVRTFTRDDIPQVADLYQRVYLPSYSGDRSALLVSLAAYFHDLFFNCSWNDDFISSLVCEDADRRVIGFTGVLPRRMVFKGRSIRMANSFHFMAEPKSHALAGVQVLKALLLGPQDFTFTDHGGEIGRRVWEGLGGSIAFAQSLNWTRLLRPVTHSFSLARSKAQALATVSWFATPVCRVADSVLSRFSGLWPGRLAEQRDGLTETELDVGTLLDCIERFSSHYALRPDYDAETLGWLLSRAEKLTQHGALQKVALRDANGEVVGSYIYYLSTANASKVLHMTAKRQLIFNVLDHLFLHAWRRGASVLAGRLDPRLMREMSNKRCRFDSQGGWTMVHSNDPDLLQAIHSGDAWLSRLEGEWCMLYQPPPDLSRLIAAHPTSWR